VEGRALNPGHFMEEGKGGIVAMPITLSKKSLMTTDMTIYHCEDQNFSRDRECLLFKVPERWPFCVR
jgi:hypothetical protein